MPPILLFDIDGTLLSVKKQAMIVVLTAMLEELGMDVDLRAISYAGRTDAAIFSEIIARSSRPELPFSVVKASYESHLSHHLRSEDVFVHADISELDSLLQEGGFGSGILTGNFERTAALKLECGQLTHLAEIGFYGDIHHQRRALSLEALSYYSERGMIAHPEHVVIIGDTPNDIDCARHAGFKSIAVTTGPFNEAQLAEHKPDALIESVRDLADALKLIY